MTRVADEKRKKKRVNRVRTGCLTCRERRVKCDEGKPTCQRCIAVSRTCKGYEPTIVGWKTFDGGSTHSASKVSPQAQRELSSSGTSSSVLSPGGSGSGQDWISSPATSTLASPVLVPPREYPNTTQHVILGKSEIESMRRSMPGNHYGTFSVLSDTAVNYSHQDFDDGESSGSELVLSNGSPPPPPARRRYTDPLNEMMYIRAGPKLFDDVTLRAIHFYKAKTIHQIGTMFTFPLWEQLPKIAYTEPSIRHAMIALSRFHERFSTSTTPQPALTYYNLAIKDLKNDIPKTTAILCLMLFYAIELLQTSHISAIKLFRVARRMLYDAQPDNSELYAGLKALIRRLDSQNQELCGEIDPALPYDVCWGSAPVKYRVGGTMIDNAPKQIFTSFNEAMDPLVAVMADYRNDPLPDHDAYLARIAQWQKILDLSNSTNMLVSLKLNRRLLLELSWRHYKLRISKQRDAPVSTMWWDQWETHFDETLDLQDLLPITTQNSTFGLETCELFELFKLGCDCRCPRIRRKVLARMSYLQMQEGVLCSNHAVQVLQRVIEIEERGTNPVSSSEIPEEHRLEEVKFDFNGDRVRIRYKLNSVWHFENLEEEGPVSMEYY